MTTAGRISEEDRAVTLDVMSRISRGEPVSQAQPNWLGHTNATAQLDVLLLWGAPKSMLEETRGAVDEHLRHLREVHGIDVAQANGVWRMIVSPTDPVKS
jgi:hypothetical protein